MAGRTRQVAIAAVLVLIVVSGCLNATSETGDQPIGSATTATPAECTGEETGPGFDFSAGIPSEANGFELTANERGVERGDPITFELTNVAGEQRTTGTSNRYALQRQIDNGWRTVTLFESARAGFNATAVTHDPGAGFEWGFRASAVGFSTGTFVVCERLRVGTYRFVFQMSSSSLAVEFELTESE